MDKTAPAPATLVDAIRQFADTDTCQAFLADLRWPDGVICPHCGSRDVTYLANQRRWKCRTPHPLRQFSIKAGTIFEDSPQKEKVGRPDIDAFEAVMTRLERTKGFFVSFAYTSDAMTEIDAYFRKSHRVIIPFTVREILDEQIAKKLA